MTTKYLSSAETAVMVRQALKEAFPKAKFSVRSDSNSIRVRWTDGPNAAQVECITNRFKAGYFDSAIDYAGSILHMLDGQQIRLGADYIFTNREFSDASVLAAIDRVYVKYEGNFKSDGIAKPALENYRKGQLYMVQLSSLHHNGYQTVQNDIYQDLCAFTDRKTVENSPTAARIMVIADDGYSRQVGSGFSAVDAVSEDKGFTAGVLAEAAIDKARSLKS